MIERKGYRFRLYPTPEQEALFRRTSGCCRLVYNLCLEQKILERHRSEPRRLASFDQINELPALKAELPFLREVPAHALQQAIVDLHRAYENFFEGRAAFPQFRKKDRRDSFRFPDSKQFRFDVDAGAPVVQGKGATAANRCRIFLPKAGWVEVVRHRVVQGKVKSATVSRVAGAWYVSILTEREIENVASNGKSSIGIDGGVTQPLVLSNGWVIALPKISKKEWRRKAALQKQLARRKKGSRNREKTKRRIASLEARFARRRKDAAEKASTHLAQNHGLVAIEDLPLRNMTASAKGTVEKPGRNVRQKAGLNRALLDVGLGQVYELLERKAPSFGSFVMRVPAAYTSQGCSACGHIAKENRPTRDGFCCVACSHVADADHNAAKNILGRAQAQLAAEHGMPLAA